MGGGIRTALGGSGFLVEEDGEEEESEVVGVEVVAVVGCGEGKTAGVEDAVAGEVGDGAGGWLTVGDSGGETEQDSMAAEMTEGRTREGVLVVADCGGIGFVVVVTEKGKVFSSNVT